MTSYATGRNGKVARGGARPGAGRPSAAATEEKRTKAQRTQQRCQDKIQAKMPELVDEAIVQALAGDKALLKFLIENGLGKAAVKQNAVEDTQIKVVLGNIPRPGKAKADDVSGIPGDSDEEPGVSEDLGGDEAVEEILGPSGDEEASAEEEAEDVG
jgi:hypothetical protein